MHRVFLIGEALPPLSEALPAAEYRITRFRDPAKALPSVSRASFIVINGGYALSRREPIKELFSESEGIPKIFVSDKGPSFARKKKLTYQVNQRITGAEFLGRLVERIEEEKKLYDETAALKKENSALRDELKFFEDLSHTLTSSSERAAVLTLLTKKIKEKTEADNCTLYLIDEETGGLQIEKTEGTVWKSSWKKEAVKSSASADSIASRVARDGKPLLIKNMYKETGLMMKMDRDLRHKIKTAICVPVRSKGRILGVLELINRKSGGEFTRQELLYMTRFTDYAAIIIERSILYEKMQELVVTDDLTKLFNTRYMMRTIGTEVLRSNRYNTSVSLIFMDIDHFKAVNDNFGHLVGSRLLVEMGQLLIKHLRELDIVTRYGGDEFVIILPQTPPQKAAKTAERIRQTVEQHVFLKKEGHNLKLTASFGVASYPENAGSREELIRLADEAMYKVKHRTRNGVYAIAEPRAKHVAD